MDKSVKSQTDSPKDNTAPALSTVPVKKNYIPLIAVGAMLVILLISGLVFLSLKPKPEVTQPVIIPQVKTESKPLTLQLTSPGEGDLAVNDEILVKGTTLPNSTVVIYTETDQTSVQSSTSGDFESTVKLTSGINSVNVSAFADDGQEKSMSINVVYDAQT